MQTFDFGLYSLNDIKHFDVTCCDGIVDMNPDRAGTGFAPIQFTTHFRFKQKGK